MRAIGYLLVVLLLACSARTANAATRTVYGGSLAGAGEVVMELDSVDGPGGVYRGRYFYPAKGVDIPLAGTADALIEPIPLTELTKDGESTDAPIGDGAFAHPAATWQGALTDDGYAGTWRDQRSGRSRAFKLRRVARYDPDGVQPGAVQAITDAISGGVGSGIGYDAEIDADHAPYETLKLAGHAVAIGDDIGDARVAYRLWRDPRTTIAYPRLVRHPDQVILKRINRLLEQRHWQMNLAALECAGSSYFSAGPAAGSLGDYDNENIEVTWLSPALMGVLESGSLYCGGAHPNNHYEPYTLDLLTGEYLDWSDILDTFVPDDSGRQSASTALLDFMRAHAASPSNLVNALIDEEVVGLCAEILPDYLALGITAPGVVQFDVSGVGHALGVCLGPQFEVPFDALSSLLKPGARRYFLPSVLPAR